MTKTRRRSWRSLRRSPRATGRRTACRTGCASRRRCGCCGGAFPAPLPTLPPCCRRPASRGQTGRTPEDLPLRLLAAAARTPIASGARAGEEIARLRRELEQVRAQRRREREETARRRQEQADRELELAGRESKAVLAQAGREAAAIRAEGKRRRSWNASRPGRKRSPASRSCLSCLFRRSGREERVREARGERGADPFGGADRVWGDSGVPWKNGGARGLAGGGAAGILRRARQRGLRILSHARVLDRRLAGDGGAAAGQAGARADQPGRLSERAGERGGPCADRRDPGSL